MSDLSPSEVRDHYRKASSVFDKLGDVANNPTLVKNDHYGWYIKRDNDNVDELEEGWTQRGRVATADDYPEIVDRISRSLYAITTYKKPDAVARERPCRYNSDDGVTEWMGDETPMPEWGDVVALPAWGDIDLADELKGERETLSAEKRETVERTLDAYIGEFAALYGGNRDAIMALDSVGGAYIFGPPEATIPIARLFKDDENASARVFEELNDRINDYLREAEQRVNDRVTGASDVITPDWVNNANRAYKAPLSIHSSHDAVVTPIDTENVEYTYTPIDAVGETTISTAVEWAEQYTAVEYTELAAELVETLWPDLYDEQSNATWKDVLEFWVEKEREREKAEQRRREKAERERAKRLQELETTVTGQDVTPHKTDVYAALDNVDTAEIVRHYACDAWGTGDSTGSNKTEFNPSWRQSTSGSSCYVDHSSNTFGDPGDGGGGYAAKAMALGEGIITDASADIRGEKWAKAVDALRSKAGENIPVWIPGKGSLKADGGEYEQTPHWAVVKAAVTLDVCDPANLEERESDDGGTYTGLPDKETYNATLDALEEHGVEHARERYVTEKRVNAGAVTWGQIRDLYSDPETPDKFARHAAVIKLCKENEYVTTRDTEEIYTYYDPDGVFERGGERDIDHTIQRELGPHYSQHEKREILGHIRARTYVDREEFNAEEIDADLVCLGNGVYDFDAGKLREHDPKYLFTQSIPWDYPENPESAECPAIEEFMDDITQREADKLTMYEFIGHALLPHYDYKAFMVLFGPGDNGKTTFYNVVEQLLGGQSNISAAEMAEIAENRFRAETVIGNYANIAAEMNARKIDDMGMIKKMTGGDTFQVEPKGKPAYEVQNTATMMFGCNEPPVLPERGRKIATRLYPIELPYEFKNDPSPNNPFEKQGRPQSELLAEITTESELQGLLVKAIEGAHRLIDRNGEFSLPETAEERMELYEQHSDPIKQFSVKCLENESGKRVAKDDVYNVYVEFCRETDAKVTSKSVFFKKLRQTTFSYSETRPRADGDGERKLYLDNATFADQAARYTDEVLFEYAETDTDTDEGSSEPLAVTDLEPGMHQEPVRAVVAEKLDAPDWLEGKGHIVDGEGAIMPYVIEGGDIFASVDEGDELVIRNVKVEEQNGVSTAVLSTITEVETASREENQDPLPSDGDKKKTAADGSGAYPEADETAETAERDDSDSDPAEHTRDGDDADTGSDAGGQALTTTELPPEDATGPLPNARRLRLILEENGDRLSKSDLYGRAADRFDMSPGNAETAVKKGCHHGILRDAGGGEIEKV
ncbi:phage/plasmid primase, P4 family (plasmid) [Haloterrigena turkmenica DSM 5511]|uniref:Phage/plasmid primase, P4 family n=1 Tax=Haloterrigena turkmenica (strain ATCC 51198 / DSM 5511 / JCM 9101 / NCIMB 13204 / VKM B-1734 / 4k) TaxID=543526 RepID=D2S3Q6_HALTV|nr:DNA primase family protein [Haloterrigena turkmenica]ADB64003.1 phage/plasmid primase, P4 family [Haloterrigena turkmenica DSM 5511]